MSSNVQRFVILYAYVEIHQLRRIVFDNYQQCPMSLDKPRLVENSLHTDKENKQRATKQGQDRQNEQ